MVRGRERVGRKHTKKRKESVEKAGGERDRQREEERDSGRGRERERGTYDTWSKRLCEAREKRNISE